MPLFSSRRASSRRASSRRSALKKSRKAVVSSKKSRKAVVSSKKSRKSKSVRKAVVSSKKSRKTRRKTGGGGDNYNSSNNNYYEMSNYNNYTVAQIQEALGPAREKAQRLALMFPAGREGRGRGYILLEEAVSTVNNLERALLRRRARAALVN